MTAIMRGGVRLGLRLVGAILAVDERKIVT